MKPSYKIVFIILLFISALVLFTVLIHGHTIALLNPKGFIAAKERDILAMAGLLSMFISIPVFTLTFFIAWKYRESNKNASYTPDNVSSQKLQFVWWALPTIIILLMAVFNWDRTHALDPHKALASTTKPLIVQVVALRWKWLFIYPEQDIATVNFLQIPLHRPITFQLTADAPMNSFWIPQLGGQMYAMTGMTTQLHLIADTPGDFTGSAAEISGAGFAGMRFITRARSQTEFDTWVASVKSSSQKLDQSAYDTLAVPSENNQPTYYATTDPNLYTMILMKFIQPSNKKMNMEGMGNK